MLSGLDLFIALAIVSVGAAIMGTVSFGFGLVVAPVLLLLIGPQSAVVTVNSLVAILMLLVLLQTRRHFNLKRVWGMALGGLVAVPLGVLALDSASPATLRIIVAVVILSLAPLAVFNFRLPLVRHPFTGPVLGFLTSLSVTTLSIGGPLAAIYIIAQRWPPQVMRTSLAFYFLLTYIAAFVLYTQAGLVNRDTIANIGVLVPGVLLGFGAASIIVQRVNERIFRYLVAAVIVAGGSVLLGREFASL